MNVTDARQLKAGRIILGMTIDDMAKACGINRNSVLRVETFTTLPYHLNSARRIQSALEEQGIVFSVREGYAEVSFKASHVRQKNPTKSTTPKKNEINKSHSAQGLPTVKRAI